MFRWCTPAICKHFQRRHPGVAVSARTTEEFTDDAEDRYFDIFEMEYLFVIIHQPVMLVHDVGKSWNQLV